MIVVLFFLFKIGFFSQIINWAKKIFFFGFCKRKIKYEEKSLDIGTSCIGIGYVSRIDLLYYRYRCVEEDGLCMCSVPSTSTYYFSILYVKVYKGFGYIYI